MTRTQALVISQEAAARFLNNRNLRGFQRDLCDGVGLKNVSGTRSIVTGLFPEGLNLHFTISSNVNIRSLQTNSKPSKESSTAHFTSYRQQHPTHKPRPASRCFR